MGGYSSALLFLEVPVLPNFCFALATSGWGTLGLLSTGQGVRD